MPIEQKTVISIVVAGRNFRESYHEITERIALMEMKRTTSPEQFEVDWASLVRYTSRPPFPTAVKDATLLEMQYEHYRIYGRDNERRAYKARKKRREAGITPRPRSQRTINTVQTLPEALIPLRATTAPYNPNASDTPNPVNAAEITQVDAADVQAQIEELHTTRPDLDPMPPFGTPEFSEWMKRRSGQS